MNTKASPSTFTCQQCQANPRSERLFEVEGYWVRECQQCQHRFAEIDVAQSHTDQVFGDDYFEGGKDGYPDYVGEKDLILNHGRKYGKIANRFMAPGRVLDIGSAAGFILQGMVDQGWQGVGVEPNAQMARYAREVMKLDVHTSSVEALDLAGQFDLVSMIQVIACFHDLHASLQKLADLTKPGGHWLIETYNKDSLTAKFSGKGWHEYCPPSVIHWFSPETLQFMAGQYGFEFVAKGRLTKYIRFQHAKTLLAYKMETLPGGKLINRAVNLIPDRWTFPYPSEDLFWMVLQKKK